MSTSSGSEVWPNVRGDLRAGPFPPPKLSRWPSPHSFLIRQLNTCPHGLRSPSHLQSGRATRWKVLGVPEWPRRRPPALPLHAGPGVSSSHQATENSGFVCYSHYLIEPTFSFSFHRFQPKFNKLIIFYIFLFFLSSSTKEEASVTRSQHRSM